MIRKICNIIWNLSEKFDMPLGKLSPWIVAGMVGRWPRKIKKGDPVPPDHPRCRCCDE